MDTGAQAELKLEAQAKVVSAPTSEVDGRDAEVDTYTEIEIEEEEANTGNDTSGGDWGLSAALGGWGFGGGSSIEEDKKTVAEAQADSALEEEVEAAAAAVAQTASSLLSGAASYFTSNLSELSGVAEGLADTTLGLGLGTGLPSLKDINPSLWIDKLEKEQSVDSNPHRAKLREHLDAYLGVWPCVAYEDWVEDALSVVEGWDQDSVVVDESFYMEDSIHRNLWNEKNIEDGVENVEGDREGNASKRKFVPARSKGKHT